MSEKPTITPAPNGPYLVQNLDSLSDKNGPVETKEKMALCRCGASSNKPFCDGTHKSNGFNSQKLEGRVPDRRDTYQGPAITVHDNRGICAHAGYCTDNSPSVFRLKKEPFVDPSGAKAEEVEATIKKCPSGALSFSARGMEHRDREGAPQVFVVPNGPYVVSGGPKLDAEFGDGASTEHFTMCRCGQSKNKPFCDGTHWNVDFDENK